MKFRKKSKLEQALVDALKEFQEGEPTANKFCLLARTYINRYGDTNFIFNLAREYDDEVSRRVY